MTVEIAPPGLRGLVVADTALGDVRGEEGFFHYRGRSAPELARTASLESIWHLLWEGDLPSDPAALHAYTAGIAEHRRLPDGLGALLEPIARTHDPLAGLRTGLSALGAALGLEPLYDATPEQRKADLLRLTAAAPTLLAALHRLAGGDAPLAPDPALGHAADYLRMVTGALPDTRAVKAVETYLALTVDHGFNASTFTARVITSTGADAAAALTGAVGALSGPLHGGAPSRALELLDAIGEPANTERWVQEQVAQGRRIMGFGHAVYRTEDPRSQLLKAIALDLGGEQAARAAEIEARVIRTLDALKPGHRLRTNVEFYAGVVMEACGLPRRMFTPTFAVSRLIGWSANVLEQATDPRIIRPAARYVGPAPEPALGPVAA